MVCIGISFSEVVLLKILRIYCFEIQFPKKETILNFSILEIRPFELFCIIFIVFVNKNKNEFIEYYWTDTKKTFDIFIQNVYKNQKIIKNNVNSCNINDFIWM